MIISVGRNFDEGYSSDKPRDQLGSGMAFRMKDWIPDLDAAVRKRGGWALSSADLNSAAACASPYALGWTYFDGDPHLVMVSDNGKVYNDKTFDGTSANFIGATTLATPTHEPIWFNDGKMSVFLQGLGAAAASPWKYTGAAGVYSIAPLGGTPPQASVGAWWSDYLLLANGYVGGTRFPNRIWISGIGTAESWNTGAAFEDMLGEVVRITPLYNVIMVFGYTDVWTISGDTPPPNSNWSQKTAFKGNGCMDGRTVVGFQNYAIWANNTGVYKTDGFTLADLTLRGGIKQRWQELVSGFNFSQGWSAAAGVYRGQYIVVVYDNNGNFVTCQVCDIERETWYEFTNFPARMFAQRFSGPGTATAVGSEELFFAHRTLPRVGKVSTCWTPSLTTALDGDGAAVLPSIETPFYKQGTASKKQVRRAYFTYDLRSAGGAPTLAVSAVTSPEENAAYAALDSLPATTAGARQRIEVRTRAIGLGLKLQQIGASADTRLADIELDMSVLEGMR